MPLVHSNMHVNISTHIYIHHVHTPWWVHVWVIPMPLYPSPLAQDEVSDLTVKHQCPLSGRGPVVTVHLMQESLEVSGWSQSVDLVSLAYDGLLNGGFGQLGHGTHLSWGRYLAGPGLCSPISLFWGRLLASGGLLHLPSDNSPVCRCSGNSGVQQVPCLGSVEVVALLGCGLCLCLGGSLVCGWVSSISCTFALACDWGCSLQTFAVSC